MGVRVPSVPPPLAGPRPEPPKSPWTPFPPPLGRPDPLAVGPVGDRLPPILRIPAALTHAHTHSHSRSHSHRRRGWGWTNFTKSLRFRSNGPKVFNVCQPHFVHTPGGRGFLRRLRSRDFLFLSPIPKSFPTPPQRKRAVQPKSWVALRATLEREAPPPLPTRPADRRRPAYARAEDSGRRREAPRLILLDIVLFGSET